MRELTVVNERAIATRAGLDTELNARRAELARVKAQCDVSAWAFAWLNDLIWRYRH